MVFTNRQRISGSCATSLEHIEETMYNQVIQYSISIIQFVLQNKGFHNTTSQMQCTIRRLYECKTVLQSLLLTSISDEGKLEEAERERIEEQVAIYIRSCTSNIRKLEALIQTKEALTPQTNAYRHGVVSTIYCLPVPPDMLQATLQTLRDGRSLIQLQGARP